MIKEFKYVLYIAIIFFFFFFVARYYFSNEFKKKSFRTINQIDNKIMTYSDKLIILDNDTNNISQHNAPNTKHVPVAKRPQTA